MAVLERDNTLKLRKANGVSDGEVALFEGKLKITEAELASKKAGLDEADALLNQAKRRLGIATVAEPATDPVADPFARPPLANGSKNADRDLVGLNAQDDVALRQARRDGKAAELQKAEARLDLARKNMDRTTKLHENHAISREEFDQATTNLKQVEPDVATKKADLAEADLFLNQAKRRLSGRSTIALRGVDLGRTPRDAGRAARRHRTDGGPAPGQAGRAARGGGDDQPRPTRGDQRQDAGGQDGGVQDGG